MECKVRCQESQLHGYSAGEAGVSSDGTEGAAGGACPGASSAIGGGSSSTPPVASWLIWSLYWAGAREAAVVNRGCA